MGLFGGKKNKQAAANEDVRGEVNTQEQELAKPDPKAEKLRQKKIKNMKGKFNETVWGTIVEIMKTDIPQFIITEPDPDIEGAEISRYVVLGFDTTIVDDFFNKSDDDVGSIMTAIKSSMDCIIENGLFDNELILMIPTKKTLESLKEFEDTFDLKFKIVYVTEDHAISIETKTPDVDDDYIYITLPEIREMLARNIYIKDKIKSLQNGGLTVMTDEDGNEIAMPMNPDSIESPINDNDIDSDSDNNNMMKPADDAEESEEAESTGKTREAVEQAANIAVTKNSGVQAKVSDVKDMTTENTEIKELESKANTETTQTAPASDLQALAQEPVQSANDQVADKLAKLKNVTQQASDEALKESNIKNATANINPQARMRTFDMAAMDQYITRKYYSDDLGLEISSEPFDAMFLQSNPYVPFVEDTSESWLTEHANNIRRDANARLAKLHHENLMLMRERYMLIITKHCESIVKSVSTDDPESRFGYALRTIEQLKREELNTLAEKAENYKREKEQHYQARLKTEMDNAANAARASFENRYGADHARELREIETDLKNNIESENIAAIENLKTERRKEAKRQLDIGITEALKLCADEYTKMLAMERKEYVRLQSVIADFINSNMAEEQARMMTLAEEHRRTNEVVKVREEYDAKYDLANREFEMKIAAVNAEMDRVNLEHENYVNEIREQHEKMMQDLRNAQRDQIQHKDNEIQVITSQLDAANSQIETLTKRYIELDEKTGRKYSAQIDMLRSERDAWTERSEQVERLHKYTDKIKVTVMIIGIVAALGIGVILGCAFAANSINQNAESPIIHYIDKDGNVVTSMAEESEKSDDSDVTSATEASKSEEKSKTSKSAETSKAPSTTTVNNTNTTTKPE